MNVATRSSDHDLTLDSMLDFPTFRNQYFLHQRNLRLNLRRIFLDTLAGRFSQDALAHELMENRTLDPSPNLKVLRQVVDQVKRIVPQAAGAGIDRAWAGYIDMTPDLLPTIDRLSTPEGLVLATGFSGHGFGMGPIVGKLVSELVVDGKSSLDLSAFRFSRFSDGTLLQPNTVV